MNLNQSRNPTLKKMEKEKLISNKPKNNFSSNKINYLVLAGTIILVLFAIWTFRLKPIETRTLEVNFSVGSSTGINIDSDKIYFGRIVPGSNSQRTVVIENGYGTPVKLKVYVTNNIADYIFIHENIIIDNGKSEKIPITINIPENMEYGEYAGKIRFDLYKT